LTRARGTGTAKPIRLVPVRAGAPLVGHWRFWVQGDEFYAGARSHLGNIKFSFHRDGNWQFQIVPGPMQRLPAWNRDGTRVHALTVLFLIAGDSLRPVKAARPADERAIDLLEDHRLQLVIHLHDASPPPARARAVSAISADPALLAHLHLRSGGLVVLEHKIEPLTDADRLGIARIRGEAAGLTLTGRPSPERTFGEMMLVHASTGPGDANYVAVVPLRWADITVRSPGTVSPSTH
jgi:hypothetical protein